MIKKPEELPESVTPETEEVPKKKRFPVVPIIIILFILFIAFCIFAVVMRLRDPNITLWSMLKSHSIGSISLVKEENVLKTRPPKLKLDQRVTKKISAIDGGSVRLTSDNGYTYEVVVAPGVRKNDVTIDLTPLEEPPFEYPPDSEEPADQPPADEPPDPGVDVDIDPEEPPADPPDPDDPVDDDGDTGIDIYVFPPGFGGPIGTLQTGGDAAGQAQDIISSFGLGNISTIDPTTPETKPSADPSTANPPSTIIIISRDGRPHIKPPAPVWANNGHDQPPEGSGADVPPDGGTATPDDPDGTKGEDQADQAAANSGGRCSAEFIGAVLNAYGKSGSEGQQQANKRYGALIEECQDEIIDYIERLCESDKRLLRRQDFVTARNLLTLAQAGPGSDKQAELSNLETSCKGNYSIDASGTQPESGSGVTMAGSLNAQVCGYFDDLWKGETMYLLTVEGGNHEYNGTTSFRLPSRGGTFAVMDKSGTHAISIGGGGLPMAFPNLGFSGTFDGASSVDLILYPAIKLKVEIPLGSAECTEPDIEIPLVPLVK